MVPCSRFTCAVVIIVAFHVYVRACVRPNIAISVINN